MSEIAQSIGQAPQNRSQASPDPERLPARQSSLRLSAASRAPELRRLAERIGERADGCKNPARARRLARDMRVRAAELELGELLGSSRGERNPFEQLMLDVTSIDLWV